MADQIDIRQIQGRHLRGFIGGQPVLGEDQTQLADIILFNGLQVATTSHQAKSPIFLSRPLSAAEVYAISQAVAKHHGTTIEKEGKLPFNYGHKKRVSTAAQEALRTRYRRR